MSAELPQSRLEEIRERANEATEGPWRVWTNDNGCTKGSAVETAWSHDSDGTDTELITDWCSPADAEFIAAARQDVPALLAEVDRLTVERNKLAAQQRADRRDHEATVSELVTVENQRDAHAATISRVESLATYWETLADGDRHYAARIRARLAGTP